MNRIAGKIVMIARSATKVVAILRCRGARHSERMILLQPFGALVLQTDCSVELVVKGLTIHCLTCLAFHPQNTVCGHVGLNQRLPNFFQCGEIQFIYPVFPKEKEARITPTVIARLFEP